MSLRFRTASKPLRAFLLLVLLLTVPDAAAQARRQAQLRHQITPGSVAVFDVRIETLRQRLDRPDLAQQREQQTGTLTRVIFREDQPGTVTCGQMLELTPVAALAEEAAEAEGETFEPDTSARAVDGELSPEETSAVPQARAPELAALVPRRPRMQLLVGPAGLDHAPLIVPGATGLARQMLSIALHVTDWPDELVNVGRKWERNTPWGAQAHEVIAIEAKGLDSHVTLVVRTDPAEAESPDEPRQDADAARFVAAETRVVWSTRNRLPVLLVGHVVYEEPLAAGGRRVRVEASLSQGSSRMLSARSQRIERQAIIHLTQAVTMYQGGDVEEAMALARTFLNRWPQSVFQPFAQYLSERIEVERAGFEPLPSHELRPMLVTLMALWLQAEADADGEVLEQTRLSLAHLAAVNRPEMMRMLEEEDERLRGLGCFVLGFGERPADVALLERALGDASARVRGTALYALALRASPFTSVKRLLAAIEDEDVGVRRRACEALAACVPPDSPALPSVRAALVRELDADDPALVIAAARALVRVGMDDELEAVRQRARAAPPDLRRVLEKLHSGSK